MPAAHTTAPATRRPRRNRRRPGSEICANLCPTPPLGESLVGRESSYTDEPSAAQPQPKGKPSAVSLQPETTLRQADLFPLKG